VEDFAMKRTIFALALALAPGLAGAADDKGQFQILGAGARPCSDYSAATPEAKRIVETWFAGYITAMNRSTGQTYNLVGNTTVEQMHEWLGNYCRTNPQSLIAIAVHAMLEAAYPNRVQKSPN
jgi:hypothetical protein